MSGKRAQRNDTVGEGKVPSQRRLTDEERDRIVELRMARVPVRTIAGEIPCAVNTVTAVYQQWLDETSEERRAQLERNRSDTIARLDFNAAEARRALLRLRHDGARLPPDVRARAEARLLAEERHALRALSKVAGYDAPTQIVGRFEGPMSEEQARALLDDL